MFFILFFSSFRPGGAKEIPKPTQEKRFLRPSGAGLSNTHLSHGLRSACLAAGCAPPVATTRGPVGAEARLPGRDTAYVNPEAPAPYGSVRDKAGG